MTSFRAPRKPLAFSYVAHLAERACDDAALAKGERRKLKLLLAAAEFLQAEGYHNLRIADVIKRAGVARGTFYINFGDKSDIALQVLSDFRSTMFTTGNLNLSGKDWQAKIFLSNLYFAEMHQMNAGLLRAFYQFVDEADEFREMRHQKEREWVERLYAAYTRVFGNPDNDTARDEVLRRLHAVRVMIEGLCMQVYVEAMPDMAKLFNEPRQVAETATNLWVEALSNSAKNRPAGLTRAV